MLLASLVTLVEPAAHAGPDDNNVVTAVKQIMAKDVADANFGAAKQKLKALLERCKKNSCTTTTMAQIYMAIGVVTAQINQTDEARQAFTDALIADPASALPANASATTKALFEEAKKAAKKAIPDKISGWDSREAYELSVAASGAASAENIPECIEKARASLLLEEQPKTRLQLSFCEYRAGKVLDALVDARKALDAAVAKRDIDSMNSARKRVEELVARVPHVTFSAPTDVPGLKVFFDQRQVPNDSLQKQFSIDPGKHKARSEGNVNGVEMGFEQEYDVQEGELLTVRITLKSIDPKFLTPGQIACMRSAQNQDEVAKCLPAKDKPLVIRAGIDSAGYIDTTAVRVFTPGISGSVSSPTGGWNVGARYLVDIVSAASPDLVSSASRAFHDVRHAVSAHGGFKPGRFGADASASFSVENDYISRSAHVGVLGDFADKHVTPRIGVGHVQDTIGRAGTPYSVFSNSLSINDIDASATIIMGPSTLLIIGGSAAFERGDQSKPYRLIPMFDSAVSAPIGASIAQVNRDRLPIRPYEQLPLDRDRYSLAARIVSRIGNTSTLRIEERVYRDSWELIGSTTDVRWIKELSKRLSVWPHLHAHVQNAANFYQRVYHAEIAPQVILPTFRTTDRELSPLVGATVGGGFRFELAPPGTQIQYAIVVQADAMYTHYFNALYITNRLAGYGTVGFEAVFE